MAGGGNDFVVFEADGRRLSEEDRRRLALVCRRGLSVGADGALFLSGGEDGHVRLDYFNADGGPADFCANGTRCAARYAVRRRLTAAAEPVIETGWGAIASRVEDERVTLFLPPFPAPRDPIGISGEGLAAVATPIEVGVPHLVVLVRGDLDRVDVARLAPPLRRHPALFAGANVDFVEVVSANRIRVRTFERGVEGETLACGSGVVAAAVVCAREGRVAPPVACGTRSGVDFEVSFEEREGMIVDVKLAGDAREVFTGDLTPEAWTL
jgi:diaminopimelate epimerase